MPKEEKEILLRTEEVNEILTATPKWILRWGISVIFILIATGIGLSYFIRYPDVLTAEITLTTLNPPVSLISKNGGKIIQLLVKNNETVQANQTLAVIENTGNYKDVIYLFDISNGLIDRIKSGDTISKIVIKDSLKVGELTPAYLSVLKSIKGIELYSDVNPYNRQITLLQKDLVNYKVLLQKYKRQEGIINEQLSLAETDLNRDKSLFADKAISARDMDNKKKEYLSALNNNESIKISTSNALIQINAIEKNILQLQIQDYQEHEKLKSEFRQNLNYLISEINKWKQQYLIESPVAGKVSFFNVWAVNKYTNAGDELFSIVPIQKQQFIGKCLLPTANSGKIEVGQKVNIMLDNYPYNENGILSGIVSGISMVPNKDKIALDVMLTSGLTTSYNKTLVYKEEMTGRANIITTNLSVMDRIFFNFRKLIDRD